MTFQEAIKHAIENGYHVTHHDGGVRLNGTWCANAQEIKERFDADRKFTERYSTNKREWFLDQDKFANCGRTILGGKDGSERSYETV